MLRDDLGELLQAALTAPDEDARIPLIRQVTARLSDLQSQGVISLAERDQIARAWCRQYVAARLPAVFRERDAVRAGQLGRFLLAG